MHHDEEDSLGVLNCIRNIATYILSTFRYRNEISFMKINYGSFCGFLRIHHANSMTVCTTLIFSEDSVIEELEFLGRQSQKGSCLVF